MRELNKDDGFHTIRKIDIINYRIINLFKIFKLAEHLILELEKLDSIKETQGKQHVSILNPFV